MVPLDKAVCAPRLAHSRLGAQILQAQMEMSAGIFYRSPLSLGEAAPVRGGVPVLFPQFADRGALPKHGFARTAPWTLTQASATERAHRLSYELNIAPGQFADWPHAACLTLQAEATQDSLSLGLRVTNTGGSSFTWTGGLHPYFAVDDVQASSLRGLAGFPVQDRYDASLRSQSDDPLRWNDQAFERLYDGCPPLTLFSGPRRLTLETSGFDQWMVWNPGQAGGDALPDLPEGDWRRFVCIEPVCVSRPVTLAPAASFEGELTVHLSR